jgi:hypothetical protein
MCPIPGNIIGVIDIAGYWWRNISYGFAIRCPVEGAPVCRPEDPFIVSPVTPERVGD